MDWPNLIWFVSYTAVLLGLSAYGVHRFLIIFLYFKHARTDPRPLDRFAELPVVTVQLPVFNELHVVERLIRSVGELHYPKDRLQIQILDDSTDETTGICEQEAARLRAQGFDVEVRHRSDRTGFKAGALEEGMQSARGEFIFILDADFVPPTGILLEMIHYFTDPQVGMVQSRWGHLNRGYSLLTRIQAMFLDGHLLMEQTARSRSGRFFNFNGTGGIWRRSCITDAGGWQHDTLTEDLDLSYRAQLAGWRFVFLKDVVSPAELPVDMNGFKSQQHRWTKGSIQTCKKMLSKVWRSPVPFFVKLEATAHLTSNFAYLLLVLLCFLIFPSETRLEWKWELLLSIPIFIAASVSVMVFYVVSQRELHPRTWLRELIYLPLLLALGIGMSINNGKAVLEALFNRHSAFNRTPKYGIQNRKSNWRRSRYRALRSVTPIIEIALALYFTGLVVYAVHCGYWGSVPFLLLFQGGFLYVAGCSLAQFFPTRWNGDNRSNEDHALPA
ncbi:MAG TPA: cellulose synthase family protein [Verrucomicrobiales bacterium]|nr:cellulose synthase family protein [Verrucomicrobiales bacterium]